MVLRVYCYYALLKHNNYPNVSCACLCSQGCGRQALPVSRFFRPPAGASPHAPGARRRSGGGIPRQARGSGRIAAAGGAAPGRGAPAVVAVKGGLLLLGALPVPAVEAKSCLGTSASCRRCAKGCPGYSERVGTREISVPRDTGCCHPASACVCRRCTMHADVIPRAHVFVVIQITRSVTLHTDTACSVTYNKKCYHATRSCQRTICTLPCALFSFLNRGEAG
jgi:hypothetical protein